MTTEPTAAPDPIRRDQLPCIPPPEFEFRSVLAARPDGQPGCFLLPGDLGPVVVRRRVTYGDWEPVRPDRWADAPTELVTPAASPNETGVGVGTCVCGRSPDPGICPDGHCKCACAHATPAPGDGRDDTMRTAIRNALRAAAYSCDGDCGLTERVCIDAHPVQVAAWTHDIVSDLYGPIDAIAEAMAGVRDREMERLRRERDDALAEADADSRTLAEVDERCDTAMARIRAVLAECDRLEAAVRANPTNPDFDGAYLAPLGHIRRTLTGQERYEDQTVGRFNSAREAAAMLRRTPRDSRDYPAVLTGARVIEDWLDGGAGGTPR